MRLNFAHLTKGQHALLLQHIERFRNDPKLSDTIDQERMKRIQEAIRSGGSLDNAVDLHVLGVYVANTYTGETGDPYKRYLISLGLPKDLV